MLNPNRRISLCEKASFHGARGKLPCLFFLSLIVLFAAAPSARAAEPLYSRIDAMIAAKADGPVSPLADDAEFLRRIYLDLAGTIPPADEARAFLDDTAADKRTKLIDRLLAGPHYPQRMTELFHVHLMERLGDHPQWRQFLRRSFAANKPWDQMAREILSPDAANEETRGAALFYSKRLENYGQNPVDIPGLVRDVGRFFLGIDVQCAQCHDHLFIDDYDQVHYHGLLAFVGHMSNQRGTDYPAVNESLLKEKLEFASVFVGEKMQTGPRLPGGTEIEIPTFAKGEEYELPPDREKKTPGVLKFRTLPLLAEEVTRPENAAFRRNIANRLWYTMMGRGIVHPLDLHHGDNPPSHPELLDLLAEEFAAHSHDIKWFLRELALTETYQRSSVLPDGVELVPDESFRTAIERRLSAEQLLYSTIEATGMAAKYLPPDEADDEGTAADEGGEKVETKDEPSPLDDLHERFAKALANPPREPEREFSPSVSGALFLSNEKTLQGWLATAEGNLTARLIKLEDPAKLAEELYLAVLTRRPTAEEQATVEAYLAEKKDDRETAVKNLAWSLLASTEFAVNH